MKKQKLPEWLEKIEIFVDKSIPFLLILLTIMIVLELLNLDEGFENIFHYFDVLIVIFFVIDLCFKWNRTRNAIKFIKLYWIDIIAVFPFYAVFRLYAFAADFFAAGETVQKFLHETVLLRETKLLRLEETAKFAKEGRFIRLFARILRVLRARWYVLHWHMQNAHKRS